MQFSIKAFVVSSSLLYWVCLIQRGEAESCLPDCTGRVEGDKTRDPTHCLRYYYCSDPTGQGNPVPSDKPLTCPDGYYFNSAVIVSECEVIVPGQEYCTGLCNPCKIECTEPGTLIPNPANCGSFFICLAGDILENLCPESTPFFDYEAQICTTDPDKCYDQCDVCEIYCTEEGKVPNPNNCHGYYYCSPPELAEFTCPNNEVFNPISLVCDNSTCPTLCPPHLLTYLGDVQGPLP